MNIDNTIPYEYSRVFPANNNITNNTNCGLSKVVSDNGLVSALPAKTKNTQEDMKSQKRYSVEFFKQMGAILNGGTEKGKLEAEYNISYYKERYQRTDQQVIDDILANEEARQILAAKKQAKLFDMTDFINLDMNIYLSKFDTSSVKLQVLSWFDNEPSARISNVLNSNKEYVPFLNDVLKYTEIVANPVNDVLRLKAITEPLYNTNKDSDNHYDGVFSLAYVEANYNQITATSQLNIDCKIDDLSALYAFYEDKAARQYSGADYDKVMDAIDELFDVCLTNLSDAFADDVVGRNDVEGIRTSIIGSFKHRANEYISIMKGKDFSSDFMGSAYEWAKDNAEFIVHKLHNNIGTVFASPEDCKYTIGDLKSFALMQLQYGEKIPVGFNTWNEESIGADLGMLGIQTKMLITSGNVSENGKSLLKEAFDKYITDYITRSNENLKESSQYLQAVNLFDPIDEEAVRKNMNLVIKSYNKSKGNFMEMLHEAFGKLKAITLSKIENGYASGKVQTRYEDIESSLYYMDKFNSDYYRYKFNSFAKMIGQHDYSTIWIKGIDVRI